VKLKNGNFFDNLIYQKCGFLDWIEQGLTSPSTQYRLYGRQFLQVKRQNQQYQSTEGKSYKGFLECIDEKTEL